MTSPDVPHVHVRLSSWEWGCCGVTPAVGESVTVALTSGLAGDDEPFATEPVVDWRPDLELVGLPSCSAHYAPVDGDPRGRRLRLYGGWHDESRVIPRVEATIVTLHVVSEVVRRRPDTPGWQRIPGRTTYRPVTAVAKFPESAGDPTLAAPGDEAQEIPGVVLGLSIRGVTEPTRADIDRRNADVERAARTVTIVGPAVAFGTTVPDRGAQITVDLGDPRLEVTGALSTLDRPVRGVTGQVSALHRSGTGSVSYLDVDAGIAADSVTSPLYVCLTVDADDL